MTMGMSPYTQYLERIGLLDLAYRNPAERYRQSLGREGGAIQRLYGLEGLFGPTLGREPGEYPTYLDRNVSPGMVTLDQEGFRDFSRSPGGIYSDAGDILRGLFSAGVTDRAAGGVSFEPYYTAEDPMSAQRDVSLGQQRNLFDLALRPRFGASGARRFANRIDTEQDLWEQQGAAGVPTGPWLEWLNSKYNLGYAP